MIYEPSEDTFLIAEQVKKFAKGRVLDMGTGSGYLAEIALEKTKDVVAVDISEEAIDFVKKKNIITIKSDLFSDVEGKFDLIIFNPPYLPKIKNEPKKLSIIISGGERGNELIERFLKKAKEYLKKNGKVLIIFSSLTPNVLELFKKYKYKFKKLSEKRIFFESIYCYLLTA